MATLSTTTIDDTLTVNGNLTAKSKAIVSGNLEVNGTSTLNKNVTIKEKGRLCISGDTDIAQKNNKAIAVFSTNSAEYGTEPIFSVGNATGVTDVAGKLTCAGTCQVKGDFYASGDVADSTFIVNVPATFNKAVNAKTNFGYFGQLELSNTTPYIDFRFNKSTADYTSRIIESDNGILDFLGGSYGLRLNKTAGVIYPLSKEGISLGSVEFPFYILRTMNAPVVTSVIEAKTNIKPFINALDEIDKTDVFNYNLKVCLEREGEDIEHTGFIIGKDYDISELLISHDGNSIDLYNAIGVTFGGVKELYQIVKDQQEEINNLKEEISLLKDKIG